MSKGKTKYTNWSEINWRKLEKKLWKLQKRIFRAKREGNVKLVKQLQKLLVKSFAAKTIAVRKITQDNRGKRTAGIDGIKSIPPSQRLKLANELQISHEAKPLRRIYIPKANSDEKRPLSIPTINDRAVQMLVKMALEPEWEAIFEPNSYGFRLGRQSHDAIEQIFSSIKGKPKWVLDADISKCFDSINHSYLLNKLGKCPKNIRVQIKAWLKAGYLEGSELFPTKEGTPQGGTVSPLLANIALHGMETVLTEWVRTWKGRKDRNLESFSFIRYADDFVCLHESKEVIEKAKDILSEFLNPIGLQLKPEKTQIVHTLQTNNGFDFLGFNIRQYQIQNGKTSKHTGVKREYKTLIKPSKKAIKRHYEKLANTVRNNRTVRQENLIKALNPIIKGWCNYHSSVVSCEAFSKLDHLVYGVLRRWCNRRHPKKSKHWIKDRYFHQVVTKDSVRNWVFKEGNQTLLVHADTKIERHVKVKGEKSPYDGNTVYWASRLGRSKELDTSTSKLLKHQKGKCSHCGATFREGDIMEIDHILPKSLGGENSYSNLQLIHAHCHDQKTSDDGSLKRGIHDKNQVREERYEAKASRTVLQTSSSREIAT